MALSQDALRLLYIISRYSQNGERPKWLKLHSLHVIVHMGVHSGAFTQYDLAPALFPFRGIKMFAMISQEATEDVERLLVAQQIERLLLNSWYYATVTALHIADAGRAALAEQLTAADREAVDPLVVCPRCHGLFDFAVCREAKPQVHLVMHRVCRCRTAGRHTHDDQWAITCPSPEGRIEEFFSIGNVAYRAQPFYL